MNNIDQALSAVRMMESSGDYRSQQSVRIDGSVERKVGAYGFVESNWGALTEALGYPGARWTDRKMQDLVAREKLERDYKELGDWKLAVMAFRYGTPVARFAQEKGYTEPKDIELAGFPKVADYMRNVDKNTKKDYSVEGKLPQSPAGGGPAKPNPTLGRAQNIVRSTLVSMRDAERKRAASEPAIESTEEPV